MALSDVLATLQADKKEKKPADKKYVVFTTTEWGGMEATYGKRIEPNDVKKLVQGIFEGKIVISAPKK